MTNVMTPRQQSFVVDMLTDIFAGEPAGTADAVLTRNIARGMFADRAATRSAIDSLIAKRDAVRAERRAAVRTASPVTAGAVAPFGCYAVVHNGSVGFFRVVAGKGRHAGRVFVNRFKSDDELPMRQREQATVMALIVADTEGAAMRFVTESKACRMCGRRLTDLDTAMGNHGYGPECVKKV